MAVRLLSEMFASLILTQPEALTAADELQGRMGEEAAHRHKPYFEGQYITVSMGDSWYSDTGDLWASLLSGLCDIQHVA